MKFERKIVKKEGTAVVYDNMGKFTKIEKPQQPKPKEKGKGE